MSNRSSSSVRGTQVVWGCMALALFLHVSSGSPANRSPQLLSRHHLAKRSFHDLNCRGMYDKSIFARLDRICVDCYNLFREPTVHGFCRENCFTSDYFKGSECFSTKYFQGCVESLLEMENWSKLKKMIDFVGK